MSVFVDAIKASYRHMKMSHMVADSHQELVEMASKIGVDLKWIQRANTPSEHFDVCCTKRVQAIKLGAIPVSTKQIARIIRKKKDDLRQAMNDLRPEE